MPESNRPNLTIIGAGLAGTLLALLLARRGWQVDVFERRPDPRVAGYEAGRSINLAMAERGLDALRQAGLEREVLAQAVMMRGRMVHPVSPGESGRIEPQLLRYGKDDSETIWSVHRGRLVLTMLDAAEAAGARIHFNRRLTSVERATKTLHLIDDHERSHHTHHWNVLFGTDGAGSALRSFLARQTNLGERFEPLGHGYKELEIPPSPDGDWRIEPNALHIWPRGGYMCIALPNIERSFTVTLFLPNEGDPSFATVKTADDVRAFFAREFPDALPDMPTLEHDFAAHPTGMLATLYLDRWHLDGDAVLLGDAAHPMVPFHGQGMNCAFEDCIALVRHIDEASDFASAFAAFEAERLPDSRAIQRMALENYIEMRDRVDDSDFLLQRELERLLAERFPKRFVPRYTMVTFRTTRYSVALERGNLQREILTAATDGLTSLQQVDMAAVEREVLERLPPLCSTAPDSATVIHHNPGMDNATLPELPTARIAVIGLGYVGLPLALAFVRHFDVLGFDLDEARIAALRSGHDATGETDENDLPALAKLKLSSNPEDLKHCNVFIVAVPTPVTRHKWPDFSALTRASASVGHALTKGAVVIYESTVYPGATEEVCVPVLGQASGLVFNRDFFVGYSPERINPGDRQRRLPDIVKVTSGSTPEAADFVDALYRKVITAGTHLAPDIRTAEAAKAIENTQRDVNIALMNELARMFARLNMDTEAVLQAAGTKWNFLPFRPGLVGGHCIGVDPYYLIHKAQESGYYPELIVAARRINDGMASYVVARLLRLMALRQINIVGARVLVMGLTFKENCPDLRNSQVMGIIEELRQCHARIDTFDPWAEAAHCREEFGLEPVSAPETGAYDAVLLAVAHRQFAELGSDAIRALARPGGVVFDIKGLLPREASDERL